MHDAFDPENMETHTSSEEVSDGISTAAKCRDFFNILHSLDQSLIDAIHEHALRCKRVIDAVSVVDIQAVVFERAEADFVHLSAEVYVGDRKIAVDIQRAIVIKSEGTAVPELVLRDEASRMRRFVPSDFALTKEIWDDALAFVLTCVGDAQGDPVPNIRVAFYPERDSPERAFAVELVVSNSRFLHRRRLI